jgi:hypothetical protein
MGIPDVLVEDGSGGELGDFGILGLGTDAVAFPTRDLGLLLALTVCGRLTGQTSCPYNRPNPRPFQRLPALLSPNCGSAHLRDTKGQCRGVAPPWQLFDDADPRAFKGLRHIAVFPAFPQLNGPSGKPLQRNMINVRE